MLVFEKLEPAVHNRQQFSCGNEELDVFLKKYAAQNQRIDQSTTHVLVNTERREEILGFITLCSSALSIEDLNPSDLGRLPRYPIPAIKIARLAVSSRFQGNKVGSALLGHAVRSALKVREDIGVRALIVDAKKSIMTNVFHTDSVSILSDHTITMQQSIYNNYTVK